MGNVSKNEALNKAIADITATKAYERLQKLFDDAVFTEVDAFAKSADGYAEAVAGYGYICGTGVYAIAQNSDVAGGAMSKAQAAKIKKVYDLAKKTGVPVITLYDSVGGRLKEGTDLLSSYGEILKYSSALSGVVPQISVVLGPCMGTQAMIAACADLVIISKDGELALNVGDNASSAKAAESGMAHIVAEDEDEAIDKARELASMLPSNNIETAAGFEFAEPLLTVTDSAKASEVPELISDADSFVELQAKYGTGAVTGLATITGVTVGIAATANKKLNGDDCTKLARFVRFCDAYSLPVVTVVDADEFCCLKSAAKLSSAYAEATTQKITLITGEAYGALYIAMAGTGANADVTFAWPTASVSALNPAAGAMFMMGEEFSEKLKGSTNPQADRQAVINEYKENNCSVFDAAAQGYVEDIIMPEKTRAKISAALDMLAGKRVHTLPKKHNNLFI